jgi:DNA recombination protein RmuC
MDPLIVFGLLLITAVVIGIAYVAVRVRSLSSADPVSALLPRLDSLGRELGDGIARATTDMAARLERTKGELRQETADRLAAGFNQVRESVEQQLASGRTEQAATLKLEIEGLTRETRENLGAIRAEVDQKLLAIGQQVQQKLDENIREGFQQFEKVRDHLKAAEEQLRGVTELGASINDLSDLLKLPHLRGRVGEEFLDQLLADFLPMSMYELQSAPGTDGRGRADAVIKFPGRTLPIDSKFPREQVLPLFETSDPVELAGARAKFAEVMKQEARRIATYIQPENGTMEMALMFLPSETLYFETIRNGELNEWLNKLHVFPVSRNTLIVTLQAIATVYKMYEFAKGYEKATDELRKAQRSFGLFEKQFEEIGKSLIKAQDAFGTAKRHLGTYTRRVTDLTGEVVPELEGPPERDAG